MGEVNEMMKMCQEAITESEALKRELELTKQMLWAAVRAVGGKVAVPYALWVSTTRDVELVVWEDVQKMAIVLQAQEKDDKVQ